MLDSTTGSHNSTANHFILFLYRQTTKWPRACQNIYEISTSMKSMKYL